MDVNVSPTPDQVGAAIRQGVLVLGGAIAGTGAAQHETVPAVAGLVGALAAFLYGQYKTRKRAKQLATLAREVPDDIAVLRP